MTRALLLLALLVWPTAAVAQQVPCPPRDERLALLARKYQEAPVGAGVTNGGTLVELLTSKDGTWTILETLSDGTSCIRGFGEGWRVMEQAPVGPGA